MTIRWCLAIALLVSSAAAAIGENSQGLVRNPGPKCLPLDWTTQICTNHQGSTCQNHRDEHCKVTKVCFAPWSGSPKC